MALENNVSIKSNSNLQQTGNIAKPAQYKVNPNGVDKTPNKDTVQLSTAQKVGIGAGIVATAVAIFCLLRGKKPPQKAIREAEQAVNNNARTNNVATEVVQNTAVGKPKLSAEPKTPAEPKAPAEPKPPAETKTSAEQKNICGTKDSCGKKRKEVEVTVPKESASNAKTIIPKTPEQKAKASLVKLYEKVIANAKKSGNDRRASIFEQCKNNIEALDTSTAYTNLLEALYKDLRLGEYATTHIKTPNIEQITGKGNSFVRVKEQNGWHYRMPLNRTTNTTIDRVSVNAVADENLIKALDELLGSGKVKGYYKTPDQMLNWLERHDPITIYLDEKATPEVLDKINLTCQKYIRSTDDVLSGEKFAPGMALQKSPNTQDIEAILTQAKNIDINLENTLRKYLTDVKSGELKTSAGYMDALNKLLEIVK